MHIRQKQQNGHKKLVENAWQKVEAVVVYASRLRDTHRDSKTGIYLVFESPVFIYKSYTMKGFGLECDRHKKEFEKTWKKSLTDSTACANI